ncbi:alpha/beta hydrolase [Sphingomonas sp. SM33]|uniref:Alpha/beta hydrolase n=1 Tax=Sphingomonas telluris TaxID=2907998 RepID=A0ABS9VLQ8_9SPHN|nr:alpha/beta hydrolase [Sphingomonas telluris]MCH8615489.1 alpha/beta hydrolase [Sphingomonas telluris]
MVLFEKIQSQVAAAEDPAVLILPGLHDSPRLHWQSYWQQLFGFPKVEFGDWDAPTLHGWTSRLDEAVSDAPARVILVGHSLGCLAAAWWARTSTQARKVAGALLVAPPDVDREDCPHVLRDFRPAPDGALPFRSTLVASRNDPFACFASSERMARTWGSQLVDCGNAGHINADSGLGYWTTGVSLLTRLMERNDGLPVRNWLLRSA